MSQPLKSVEFLSGRMLFDPATKKVTPDPTKGKIHVFHNSDGEKHFKWIDLATNNDEMDLYIFPSDAKFEKVAQSKSRVYLLSFESNDDKYFFWMQHTEPNQDSEVCKQVNDVINFEEDIEIEEEQKENEPVAVAPKPNANQNDLLAQFTDKIQQAFLKMSGRGQQGERDTPYLSEVLKAEYLNEIAENKEFQDALIPLLPEDRQNLQELRETLKSPQFLQALDSLDRAVNNEEGASVLASLGLDASLFLQNYDGSDALYQGLLKLVKKTP